jgi:uncharacterized membrane protein
MLALFAAALLFVAIHVGISGTAIRDRLTRAIGDRAYMVVFSVASVASIVWLINVYKTADYLPIIPQMNGWKALTDLLMLPAFLLVVIGLTTPNPTAFAQEKLVAQAPRGIVRITRHPFLMGVALWAFLHLVANGDLASILFFGSLFVTCAAGAPSIDAKRRRSLGGPAWDNFAGKTSVLPFAAIAAGRNQLALGEFGWWRPSAGLLAYVLFIGGHIHIIGVSPFPAW